MSTIQRSFSLYTKGRGASPGRSSSPIVVQKVLKSGWLKKQGGNFKTWNNRWFVIRGDVMYYYQKDDELKELGMIPLPGNKVVVHQHNIDEPGKFLFDIVPGRPGQPRVTATHETYPLWASSKEERDDWISVIHRVIYAPIGGGVFGQCLEETMMYEKKRKQTRTVPKIVEQCVDYLTKHALDTEGLFRLPGSNKTVKNLKWDYDTAIDVDLERDEIDVHSVASLLKLYLRELPEPVIPFQYYEMFLTMGLKIEHGDTRAMDTIHTLLDQLPPHNYNLLKYLCEFLYNVGEHSDQNKMPAMNLALVFGPNVLRVDDDNPTLMMSTTDLTTKTIFMFIEKHEEVFTRELKEDGSLCSPSDNLLTIDYNSKTFNMSQGRKQSPSPNLRKRLLNNSVMHGEPPVGELVNLDVEDKSDSPAPLLSPETGETKTSSIDSDSSPIAQRISMFEKERPQYVSYRSGSESRRHRRSDKIVMCQKYAGEKSSSSPESSPDILQKGDIREGIVSQISATLNFSDGRPVPPLRRKSSMPESTDKNELRSRVERNRIRKNSEDSINETESTMFYVNSPHGSKTCEKIDSDSSSLGDSESLNSFRNTFASSASSEPDLQTLSSTIKTVASLEKKLHEQNLKHQREVKDIKQKYETKLKLVEDMFKEKVNLLAQQLIDEKAATKQTVERIICLQGQLQMYQMKYGPLDEDEYS